MAARALPDGNGGGYDYEFVKTPTDTLICTVCFLPSREPHLSVCCGHTFCTSCLEGSKKFSNICPMCRSEAFTTIFNKQANRVIQSLHVFCTNKKQGCEWQGEVNDITNHLSNCLFQVIHCPNDCGESLQRQYLTSHVETECPRRKVSCQYCNDVGEYQFIEGQHKEKCPKLPVQCPNECEIESIHRDEVEEHREVCPLEMIQCDYHVVGCEVKMARKDMNIHKQEKMEVHLSLSINELMETREQLQFTQNNFKHEVEKTAQQFVLHTTKIADTEQQLVVSQQEAKKIKENFTQQFAHTEKNLTAKLMASQQEAKRTTDQLLQKLTDLEEELDTTKQQLAATCQNLARAEKEHITLAASTDKALTEMENKFQARMTEVLTTAEKKITELETKVQQRTELIEGKIPTPWGTSLQYRASKFSSDDQAVPVVVKMTEFAKHMHDEWFSAPFYDNCNKEHKIQLKVTTNTKFSFLRKPWIKEAFKPKLLVALVVDHMQANQRANRFVVKLLNQKDDNQHCSVLMTLQCNNNKKDLISFDDLCQITPTCQLLKDGTLFFEVLKS